MSFKIFIKEKKIEIGVLLIILNFAIGIVAKIPFFELIANPSDFKQHPMYYLSAIIVYIFSWVLLFIGILLIGEETINAIKKKMQRKMGLFRLEKLPKRRTNFFNLIAGQIRIR